MELKEKIFTLFIMGLIICFTSSLVYSNTRVKTRKVQKEKFTIVTCDKQKMLLTVKDNNGKTIIFTMTRATKITKDAPEQEEKDEGKKDDKDKHDESIAANTSDLIPGLVIEVKFQVKKGIKTVLKIDIENGDDENYKKNK